MSLSDHKLHMSPDQFGRLRDIISDRSGIHFPDNKKYVLESRLGHRLRELELDDYDQYIAFLTIGPYQTDEFQEMFNRITINETSFFRNEPQLTVFERQILPKILDARSDSKRLRIWSAAYSSGEEPYTLAMLVHRTLGVRLADWHVEILGTDISQKVLDIAQAGKYTNYSIRSTPELVKKRYFRRDGQRWIINDEVRDMVCFEIHNLNDRLAARRHGLWDVIFCRNVLIYFDDDMQNRVVETLAESLADDGCLFIGHSENIRGGRSPFAALPVPQGFAYEKLTSATPKAAA